MGSGRRQPEDGVDAVERPGDGVEVAVGSLHDVDALAQVSGEAGGVACDHADGRVTSEDVVEDLAADEAGGCGDEDHGSTLRPGDRAGPIPLRGD